MRAECPPEKVKQPFPRGLSGLLPVLLLAGLLAGCATKGLLTQRYEPEAYRVPRLLPKRAISKNPTFVVYGDTQAAWRLYDRCITRENWWTWKMLVFPFYELYWLGNGLVGGLNYLRGTPDYGRTTRTMMRDALYEESKRSPLDFILNTGDIVAHDGRRPDHWLLFVRENKHQHPLLNEVPYLPTVGNHERANDQTYGGANYKAVFGFPPFYALDFPDMALFVVDSSVIIDWEQEIQDDRQDELFEEWLVSSDPGRPAWLERELTSCRKPFKVISMHHPPLSFGHHWKDWTNARYGRDLQQKRRLVLGLLRKHGVQVVFSGHDHIYQHNVLRASAGDPLGVEEIHFVISSGGGVPLREPKSSRETEHIQRCYRQEGFDVAPLKQKRAYNYCLVGVDSSQMRIQTFEILPDRDQPPLLLEEIIIPRPETHQGSADHANADKEGTREVLARPPVATGGGEQ